MSTIRRLPYRVPNTERIIFGEWNFVFNGDIQPLTNYLPHWDPAVTITALIPVQVDCSGTLDDCGLGSDAKLMLAALWNSPGTVLSGRGDVIHLDMQFPVEQHHLQVSIDGILAAQSVNLTAQLLLLHPGQTPQPFAPLQPGSILATTRQSVRLEGEGSRFPIEIIDFGPTQYASGAGWALYWNEDDLHQTILGSVRLYINARHEHIVRAVSQKRLESAGVWEAIRFDVARTLIYGALENDEFISMPKSFGDGSVGAIARDLIYRCFPQMSMQQCRDHSRHRLVFETQLQEALRIFWEA